MPDRPNKAPFRRPLRHGPLPVLELENHELAEPVDLIVKFAAGERFELRAEAIEPRSLQRQNDVACLDLAERADEPLLLARGQIDNYRAEQAGHA